MDAAADPLITCVENGVGWMTFNNPARHNALTDAMCKELVRALDRFAADPTVRLCVMRGMGEKAFTSGAAISGDASDRQRHGEPAPILQVFEALRLFQKPMVALIRGWCLGGGLAVAMKADFRIADNSAQLGVPAARLGAAYPLDAVIDLVNLVGPSKAKAMLFTGQRFSAPQALAMGLVDEVLAWETIETRIADMASAIVNNAPLSIRAAKAAVDHVVRGAPSVVHVQGFIDECHASSDFEEGRRAFLEKRPPAFKGI